MNPETCKHTVTIRVSGTRDLWKCSHCEGILVDNVDLLPQSDAFLRLERLYPDRPSRGKMT